MVATRKLSDLPRSVRATRPSAPKVFRSGIPRSASEKSEPTFSYRPS